MLKLALLRQSDPFVEPGLDLRIGTQIGLKSRWHYFLIKFLSFCYHSLIFRQFQGVIIYHTTLSLDSLYSVFLFNGKILGQRTVVLTRIHSINTL